MNQIASALLILSATICGTAAVCRPTNAPGGLGGILGLVSLGLGLWGGMALLTAVTRDREYLLDEAPPRPLAMTALGGLQNMAAPSARRMDYTSATGRDYRLPPELSAQVAVAAEMTGKSRTDIVDDTLRRHLPRYGGARVAG